MIKTIIWTFVLSFVFVASNAYAIQLLCRVGSQYPPGHPKHGTGWRDGEIVDIRASGFYKGSRIKMDLCVIGFPNISIGSITTLNIRKRLNKADSIGRYKWDDGYDKEDVVQSRRDLYVDFQRMLDNGRMNQAQYDSIYDHTSPHIPIQLLTTNLDLIIREERIHLRINERVH